MHILWFTRYPAFATFSFLFSSQKPQSTSIALIWNFTYGGCSTKCGFHICCPPKMSPTDRYHILSVNLKRSLQRGASWNSQPNIDTLLSGWSDLFKIKRPLTQYFCLKVFVNRLRLQNRLFVPQFASLNQMNFILAVCTIVSDLFVAFCCYCTRSSTSLLFEGPVIIVYCLFVERSLYLTRFFDWL